MKKSILLIILSVTLLLSSCINIEKTEPEKTTAASPNVYTSSVKNVERYSPSGYSRKYLGFSDSEYVLVITHPDGWIFSSNEDGSATISREGREIGSVIKGRADDTDAWEVVETDSYTYDKPSNNMFLERSLSNGDVLRIRCEYSYKEASTTHVLTLICDYTEINDFSMKKLLSSTSLKSISSDTAIGSLSDISDAVSIAILGNSFVGSSEIGSILQEMFDNNRKFVRVSAMSRGYATVNTYISDSSLMSNIRDGFYDAIFICGFYNSGEIANLGTLKTACDSSGTKLIIFPAHNENAGVVSSACSNYRDLVCLNWKAELDTLISRGVDRWDLCIDDTYDHSLPMAGYVGAHMIYRAMYGEVPTASMSYSISQSEINRVLGDYHSTGGAKLIDSSSITYIK